MKQLALYAFCLQIFASGIVFASGNDSLSNTGNIIYEKVYLHVDRELYAPGDDIWFKSYLVGGISHQPVPGYKNIYVELISDSGVVVNSKLILSKNGSANGDFQLPQDMKDGAYTLRAYTKYLRNFGPESYFHKKIIVSGGKNSLELQNSKASEKSGDIDVSFLPEGGSFVLNAINHVAFKAIDQSGKGIDVSGKVVDETGQEVVLFRSVFKGMGKFMIMPQEGHRYYALIDNHPNFSYEFGPANPAGVSLSYKPDGNYLLVTLTRNLKMQGVENYLLKATHKGIELFYSQVTMTEFQHAQRLYKGLFPHGISKITVLDAKNNVVAERLVFVQDKNDKPLQLRINKDEFKTREKVNIELTSLLASNDTIASLSVAVVNEDYLSSEGNNQTIESYLLLDSELKGSIESPASFFTDENKISAEEKLDLAMMVNGWRTYLWNDIEIFRGKELVGWADYGLSVKGKVIKQWGRKPVEEGKVTIGPFSDGFIFEETLTDQNGVFSFDKLYLKDRAKIMINAQMKNGSKRTDILIDEPIHFDAFVNPDSLRSFCANIGVPMKFYRENYYRKIAENEFLVKSGILLDEIEAVGNKVTGDGHFRLYGEADVSLVVLEDDIDRYPNILEYLNGRVAGVVVSGEEVRIRGASGNPLLIVDGIATDWSDMINTPMGDIDKIEILKTGYGMSVYGSRGGNGVIAILTKMGKGEWENNWVRTVHGRVTPTFRGFQQPREFYSPKYNLENLADPKPDFRPTLLWQPDVKIENGKANIEFFTADNLARYHVFIEGISKTGKICFGTGLFTVSVPRR